MDHTKIYTADLDPPCRELSVRSIRFGVALLVRSVIIFCVGVLGEQSSCRYVICIGQHCQKLISCGY